jgi:NADH:ubiquinone oxidoreductase subunit 6 (subunit J)
LRIAVLTIVLLFIAGLGVLTGLDLARNGVTIVGILAILILVLFMVGIVGALRQPPRE